VAAAITLGSGASLGPEGPSVDIGKSVAQGLGSSLRSRQRHLTALIAAGSGAGVAAGFNAPISGVFFAVETVLQRTRRDPGDGSAQQQQQQQALTIAMVLLASVLAAIVSQAGLGSSPAFRVPEYRCVLLFFGGPGCCTALYRTLGAGVLQGTCFTPGARARQGTWLAHAVWGWRLGWGPARSSSAGSSSSSALAS
jgi:H+/Cl- antiporter ClcA